MIDRQETFGEALRRLMKEQRHTLRTLEVKANMSKSKLSGMCRPGVAVADEDAQALDAILQSGLTLVSAARRDRQFAVAAVLLGPNRYTDLAVSLSGGGAGQGVSAVDRREFLQAGMLVPAVVLELGRLGLSDAMTSRSDVSAAEWEEIVTEHGFAYMTTSPEHLLEQLMIDVLAIQYAADGEREDSPRARDLQRCAALLAALTAMTVANLGQLREGRRWWRTARLLADKSTDPATRAWVRGREIVRAMYEQRPIEMVLTMAEAYEHELTGAPQDAMPEFLGGKAQALALAGRGDEAGAVLPHFVSVCERLPTRITAQGASIFGWSLDRQRFTESFVHSFLGDYEKAAVAQDAAISLYPKTYVRGPAQIELQRSLCLAKTGDSVGAARHALSVLGQLSAADHIRPIVDLAYRVDASIPASDSQLSEVLGYRDYLSTPRQIEAA
jgi:hypothetical protein